MRTSRVISATAIIAAAGLLGTSPAYAGGTHFTPGAAGAGDPYFPDMGNGGYDVGHYDLTLAYVPKTRKLTGTAVIHATATQNLSRFDLDFQGPLKISRLTVNGGKATWKRTGAQELVITPKHGLRKGNRFTVTVAYAGIPQKIDDPALGISGWVTTSDGAVALNQPFGAATFFPVNDSPRDKATYTYTITVPKGLTALANGVPAGVVKHRTTTTYRWQDTQPTASELTLVAIGKYHVTTTRLHGLPNITAIQAKLDPTAGPGTVFNKATADIVAWEEGIFGPYPFASAGGIITDAQVGYSLETQTRPVYDQTTSELSQSLLAHELAHQWYGDSLTPYRWADIWLNEGFATYTEWLYSEKTGGKTVQQIFDSVYARSATDPRWAIKPGDPGRDHIFDWAVYDRGAMTLQMIRKAIGDPAFFTLLKRWAAEHRYRNVSTAEFEAFAEQVGGKDLHDLFQKWVWTASKPAV